MSRPIAVAACTGRPALPGGLLLLDGAFERIAPGLGARCRERNLSCAAAVGHHAVIIGALQYGSITSRRSEIAVIPDALYEFI